MRQLDAASNVGFAFALELGPSADNAVGELCWNEESSPATAASQTPRDLHELFQAVHTREPMRLPCPSGGEVALTWF